MAITVCGIPFQTALTIRGMSASVKPMGETSDGDGRCWGLFTAGPLVELLRLDAEVLLFRPQVPAEEDCCGVTVVAFLWLRPKDLAWLSAREFWGIRPFATFFRLRGTLCEFLGMV